MSEQVLTPWQEARAVAEAFPGHPDALAISNMVAEELGDESANAKAAAQIDKHYMSEAV